MNGTLTYHGSLAPNDILIIDTCSRQVTRNGIDVLDQISGSFFTIEPGYDQLLYQDNEQQRLLVVSVTFKPHCQ